MIFNKPILCLDFDGVIHSYTSGWQEADFIPDPPVEGALDFLYEAIDHFDVRIFSSRSHQPNGIRAMQLWLKFWAQRKYGKGESANKLVNYFCMGEQSSAQWPQTKPPALVTLDDRALQFQGVWPKMEELKGFKPWNPGIARKAKL